MIIKQILKRSRQVFVAEVLTYRSTVQTNTLRSDGKSRIFKGYKIRVNKVQHAYNTTPPMPFGFQSIYVHILEKNY